ncbi:DUF397 domain-containing protein [Actinoalloteichus hymeniacidonis]|nr:DUF397 domain-containing protein [Actinoalloteichus hymeniacidonis]
MPSQRFDRWKKATRSVNTTNCVEVGRASGLVGIRDTKDPDGGAVVIRQSSFDSFLRAVKADRLG